VRACALCHSGAMKLRAGRRVSPRERRRDFAPSGESCLSLSLDLSSRLRSSDVFSLSSRFRPSRRRSRSKSPFPLLSHRILFPLSGFCSISISHSVVSLSLSLSLVRLPLSHFAVDNTPDCSVTKYRAASGVIVRAATRFILLPFFSLCRYARKEAANLVRRRAETAFDF